MRKKFLLTFVCVLLVAAASVLGTLAYLTDTDSAVNTFTIGQIDIELDEARVDPDGQPVLDDEGEPVDRVKGNEYHLIPGRTYTKDPTITVKANGEASYIRILVIVNCLNELDTIFAPDGAELETIFGGYDPSIWVYVDEVRDETANTITYEFRYKEIVEGGTEDLKLEPLFDNFTVPGVITGEDLKTIQNLKITVEGHAIQAAGFSADSVTGETAEDVAWKAFDQQRQ